MDRSSSSPSFSVRRKCSLALVKMDSDTNPHRKQPKSCSRIPLKDINGMGGSSSAASTSTSTASSSLSGESRRSCLGFCISNNYHSNRPRIHAYNRRKDILEKTPKSAPNERPSKVYRSRPFKENLRDPTSQMFEKSRKTSFLLHQRQSGEKKSRHRSCPKSKLTPISGKDLKSSPQRKQPKITDETRAVCDAPDLGSGAVDSTSVCGSAFRFTVDKSPDEHLTIEDPKTPPIEPSFSPVIPQCGSFLLSPTPVCYGAGHVFSGISDSRKCRARGILTVGGNDSGLAKSACSDKTDDQYVSSFLDSPKVVSPAEASMHWLLSPCNEEDECPQKYPAKDSHGSQSSVASLAVEVPPSSPSSCGGSLIAGTRRSSRTKISLDPPRELPKFPWVLGPQSNRLAIYPSSLSPDSTASRKAKISQEKREHGTNSADVTSSNSMYSLGSDIFIQTPPLDSSFDGYFGPSWVNGDDHVRCRLENELDSVAAALKMTSLSFQRQLPISDSMDSCFQLAHSATPSNFDYQCPKTDDYEACCILSSSLVRIPLDEGSVSRIFEVDEADICRCFSDEDEGADQKPGVGPEDDPLLVNKHLTPESDDDGPGMINPRCRENSLSQ